MSLDRGNVSGTPGARPEQGVRRTQDAAQLLNVLLDIARAQDVRDPRDRQEDRAHERVAWTAGGLLAADLALSLASVLFPNVPVRVAGLAFSTVVALVVLVSRPQSLTTPQNADQA